MHKRLAILTAILILFLAPLIPTRAEAKGIQFIRDAEIENIIRIYSTPLFQVAGLDPQAITVYLIKDRALNAFATPGLNMMINTGLLMRAEDPLQVIGVIAHETAHLANGHAVSRGSTASDAQASVIAAYILGLGAAIATGRGEIATAVISGGQDIALKGLLRYTRGQESAADQAALKYLNANELSPQGMLDFMNILGDQEALLTSSQDPYLRTHPLTRNRVKVFENEVANSPYGKRPATAALIRLHSRMRAKLVGFLEPISKVFRSYPESDTSLVSRYARAIAHYREAELDKALPLIDGLIAEHPDDPYFHELKGQILFENNRGKEALPSYEAAVRLVPESPQLRLALAKVQIEANDPALDKQALKNLVQTLREEPNNAFAWRLTATAYGRQGKVGLTALSLAESALARGSLAQANDQAVRAQKLLPEGSPSWLRAQDLENLVERLREKK